MIIEDINYYIKEFVNCFKENMRYLKCFRGVRQIYVLGNLYVGFCVEVEVVDQKLLVYLGNRQRVI